MQLRKAWSRASVTLVLSLVACSDLPTAGDHPQESSPAHFFDRAPAPGFGALEWRDPILDVRTSQDIGPAGGVVNLPGTGVEIHFPEGAVSASVQIEARTVPGSVVAFEFGKHGLTFHVPIEIRIAGDRLAGSWLEHGAEDIVSGSEIRSYLEELLGVYFVGDPTSGVTPVETFPIYIDDGFVVFEVTHFSGYAVASG